MSETRAQYGEAEPLAQHTPGPWIILEYDESWDSLEITSTDRMERLKSEIANIPAGFDGDIGAEQQANARLIAAAPDLLKELRRMVETCEACDDIAPHLKGHIASARAVVAKATGSPGGESQPPAEPRELLCMLCSTEYAPWFAPNALWNAAVRRPDGTDEVPFLCPTCFTRQALLKGINQVFVQTVRWTGVWESPVHDARVEVYHQPTHWMPLPPAPESQEAPRD